MDENPYKSPKAAPRSLSRPQATIGAVVGLAACVIIGAIITPIALQIALAFYPIPPHATFEDYERRGKIGDGLLYGGFVGGIIAGAGIFEICRRLKNRAADDRRAA